MYFVTPDKRLTKDIHSALYNYFGDIADVSLRSSTEVQVNIVAGYPRQERKLTQEELDREVIGGGVFMECNGRTFVIKVEELKENPGVG